MGRSALCSPCADLSPDGGGARSCFAKGGELMSIMVTDMGMERAGDAPDTVAETDARSESHSPSAPGVPVGRLTTVAVTVTGGRTAPFAAHTGPGAPHWSTEVRSRRRSWCVPRRRTRRTRRISERTVGAAYAVPRRKVDADDQGGASSGLRGQL